MWDIKHYSHSLITVICYTAWSSRTCTAPGRGQTGRCLGNRRMHLPEVLARSYIDVLRCVLCVAEPPAVCNTPALTFQLQHSTCITRLIITSKTSTYFTPSHYKCHSAMPLCKGNKLAYFSSNSLVFRVSGMSSSITDARTVPVQYQ